MTSDPHRPTQPRSEEAAVAAARLHFGLLARASKLQGDLDQNFLLQTPTGERFVLKFYAPDQSRTALEQQTLAMAIVGDAGIALQTPQVLPSMRQESLVALPDGGWLRLLSWIDGTQWVQANPQPPALLADLGRQVALLSRALQACPDDTSDTHPADSPWNLLGAQKSIASRLNAVASPARRALLERWLPRVEATLEATARLPHTWLHNDVNDHNVLLSAPSPGSFERHVTGLIDFGDLCRGPRIIEPATAAAYACLHKQDPLAAIAQVAAGYCAHTSLGANELELLPLLSATRLCLSVAMSAQQQIERPDNAYLSVSETPAWQALERLELHSNERLQAQVREACGLPPSDACTRLQESLAGLKPARVLPEAFYHNVIELDLSLASPEIPSISRFEEQDWQAQLQAHMLEQNASMAIGAYDEARFCYLGASYALPGEDRQQRRSVHLGIDLFAPAGTPVFAPLASTVFAVQDNFGSRNYGPTVILEHELEGTRCYSLYGHLGRGVIKQLHPGQSLAAGQPFAELGRPDENGGWPPHLHLQWIADMLGHRGDFPGVAAPDERGLWLALCPDPRSLASLPPLSPSPGHEVLRRNRQRHHGAALSLSHRAPLHLVRGEGTRLFDDSGRDYLDAVNNVPHVGHGHPHVVRAASRQMALLNTNTRYLSHERQRYMERLIERFPAPLSVCYLVCTGSEANELALRLARAHSQQTGIAVLDSAYHGNTSSLIELSPYKFDGPGGAGRPAHVQVVPTPDDYRGTWQRGVADRGQRYGDLLLEALEAGRSVGHSVGAFFAESLLGCAGQIVLPPGFLERAYGHVRAAGGLCIADEVQVGFGRVGTHFWGFETQGVVPDIVTLGKPIGNGHPLAAVITTPAIAASFDQGMEYFNTFGGSPVSAAVGSAVLDVIENQKLQENALRVGQFLGAGLRDLAQKHPVIGDVRGAGLFLGLELVHDQRLEPAASVASYVVERMREHGVLIGCDGPLHNVLKIKPPLVFSLGDAEQLLGSLDSVLAEDPAQP